MSMFGVESGDWKIGRERYFVPNSASVQKFGEEMSAVMYAWLEAEGEVEGREDTADWSKDSERERRMQVGGEKIVRVLGERRILVRREDEEEGEGDGSEVGSEEGEVRVPGAELAGKQILRFFVGVDDMTIT